MALLILLLHAYSSSHVPWGRQLPPSLESSVAGQCFVAVAMFLLCAKLDGIHGLGTSIYYVQSGRFFSCSNRYDFVMELSVYSNILLQMMDALDIVNRNTADLTESWAVCRTQIETMQHAVEVVDDSRLVWTACGDCSNAETYDGAGHETVRQCAEQVEDATSKFSEPDNLEHMQGINSDTSASNYANEILCLSADVRDKSDQSTLNSAGSSARVPRNKQTSLGLKPQSVVTSESKEVVGSRKNVASRTPKKTENTSIGKKDGSSPNVTSRQPSMSSRGSFDVNSSRWSAPLSSRASSKQVDLAARRPSVPKQTARQPIVTGGSKQENQTRRKLSAVSASSRALLRDQKTASESSLAAGDFTNLSSQASLRSSTPVTSSVGDSNDPSSISCVSSVSDASSPSASHGSSGALSASAFQSPKPSTGPGKLQHLLMLQSSH